MTRIGILGAGGIAATMAGTLRKMKANGEPVRLCAIGSREEEKARAFAEKEGFEKSYGSYEALAADPEVDLIYIASPHSHHAEHARLCLENGKAILCEKSFTANAAQAREVLSLAKEKGILAAEAIWTRYMPSRKMIDDLIRDGAIGAPRVLTANLGYPICNVPRLRDPNLAGGALLDVGVYALNFASMVLGNGIRRRESCMVPLETGVDLSDSITYFYDGGVMAQLMATSACQTDRRGIIYGEKGFLVVENINNPSRIEIWLGRNPKEPSQVLPVPAQLTGYEYEVRACMKALEEGALECPEMPHSETIALMEQMDALRADWGLRYPFE